MGTDFLSQKANLEKSIWFLSVAMGKLLLLARERSKIGGNPAIRQFTV